VGQGACVASGGGGGNHKRAGRGSRVSSVGAKARGGYCVAEGEDEGGGGGIASPCGRAGGRVGRGRRAAVGGGKGCGRLRCTLNRVVKMNNPTWFYTCF
jgi:hypothetical protein